MEKHSLVNTGFILAVAVCILLNPAQGRCIQISTDELSLYANPWIPEYGNLFPENTYRNEPYDGYGRWIEDICMEGGCLELPFETPGPGCQTVSGSALGSETLWGGFPIGGEWEDEGSSSDDDAAGPANADVSSSACFIGALR